MGCDIHLYIEYKPSGADRWRSFGERINPGRNYQIFGRLAGVRCEDEQHIAPRGVPEDMSYSALGDHWLYVTDRPGDGSCTRQDAERYISNCGSRWRGSEQKHVSHPDWHTHSWLTTSEFADAIGGFDSGEFEYRAILAAMRSFEADGCVARVVFWFDN